MKILPGQCIRYIRYMYTHHVYLVVAVAGPTIILFHGPTGIITYANTDIMNKLSDQGIWEIVLDG